MAQIIQVKVLVLSVEAAQAHWQVLTKWEGALDELAKVNARLQSVGPPAAGPGLPVARAAGGDWTGPPGPGPATSESPRFKGPDAGPSVSPTRAPVPGQPRAASQGARLRVALAL